MWGLNYVKQISEADSSAEDMDTWKGHTASHIDEMFMKFISHQKRRNQVNEIDPVNTSKIQMLN